METTLDQNADYFGQRISITMATWQCCQCSGHATFCWALGLTDLLFIFTKLLNYTDMN